MRKVTLLLAATLVGLLMALAACDTLTGSSQIADLETRNAQLQGTIQGVGTPLLTIAVLEQAATQNVIFRAQLTESAVSLLQAQATLTVLQLSGGGGLQPTPAAPAAPPGDQPPGVPTPIPVPSATPLDSRFTNTVLTTQLDPATDCPISAASRFSPTTPILYVNTRIDTLLAGSRLGARWYAGGQLVFDDSACWIPTQNYTDICAYCTLQPGDAPFTLGEWTVELYLDGQLMSQARFEIVETAEGTSGANRVQ